MNIMARARGNSIPDVQALLAPSTASGRPIQGRAANTRRTIITAAAVVFDRSGYTATTLDDVIKAAGVTRGALAHHFASKSLLAAAIVVEHHDIWRQRIEASGSWGLNGLDTVERLIMETAQSFQSDPIAQAGSRLGDEHTEIDVPLPPPFIGWIKVLTTVLHTGQTDGSVSPDLDCSAAARMIVGSFYGIQAVSARLNGRNDLLDRINEWWTLARPTLENRAPTRRRTER